MTSYCNVVMQEWVCQLLGNHKAQDLFILDNFSHEEKKRKYCLLLTHVVTADLFS